MLYSKNKIALVTGSSRGIGKSCALSLAKEGVKVVISGRDQNTLNNTQISSQLTLNTPLSDLKFLHSVGYHKPPSPIFPPVSSIFFSGTFPCAFFL